jgi:hypothetical protein
MITAQQLLTESNKLIEMMNEPAYQSVRAQTLLGHALNVLAWVNDGEPPPPSQGVADLKDQGLLS